MTGRDLLTQSLREKCLHDLISQKYSDEGVLFWTFFKYLDTCFIEDKKKQAQSLNDCYDWSTVKINGYEEIDNINKCVKNSFEDPGNQDSYNKILADDSRWAALNNLKFHPSITINNKTYDGNVKGMDLAVAICAAYNEKPDECELSWKIRTY